MVRAPSMREAIDVFGEWAEVGKDEGMERGHAAAVEEMLEFIFQRAKDLENPFTITDLGCGNGWVVRKLTAHSLCHHANGIDGAEAMINKAKQIDPSGDYQHAILPDYFPENQVDFVHSMEFIYYLEDPISVLKEIREHWLKPNGWAVFGIDFYQEHHQSHDWPEKVGVHMTMMSASEWLNGWKEAGFTNIQSWHANPSPGFPGTLVITGQAS
ncbi:MAG: nodulation protein S NodS [Euryarchaeota archaeon]|nr:nodulation protein S NodS [Euryarchaeota archaeon]